MDEMKKKASLAALKKISSTLRARRIAPRGKMDAAEKDLEQEQPKDPPDDVDPKKVKC